MEDKKLIELNHIHKSSSLHREKILNSNLCGCFYCLDIYKPSEIIDWCDQNETALCPKCGIDSVLPESNKYTLDRSLLSDMKQRWF